VLLPVKVPAGPPGQGAGAGVAVGVPGLTGGTLVEVRSVGPLVIVSDVARQWLSRTFMTVPGTGWPPPSSTYSRRGIEGVF
jgi:hypothetical protein